MSAFAGCMNDLAALAPEQGASHDAFALRKTWVRARLDFLDSASTQYTNRRTTSWFTSSAASVAQSLSRPDLNQVRVLLDELADAAWQANVEPTTPLRASVLDNGTLLIEWTLPDRRLGFSFESNPEESGWYFVFSKGSSERYEAGSMDQLDVPRLLRLMTKTR